MPYEHILVIHICLRSKASERRLTSVQPTPLPCGSSDKSNPISTPVELDPSTDPVVYLAVHDGRHRRAHIFTVLFSVTVSVSFPFWTGLVAVVADAYPFSVSTSLGISETG